MTLVLFFQIVFLIASVIVIVLNVGEYNKWQEARKEGSIRPYPIKWFNFILISWVAVGCLLNIIVGWISH